MTCVRERARMKIDFNNPPYPPILPMITPKVLKNMNMKQIDDWELAGGSAIGREVRL